MILSKSKIDSIDLDTIIDGKIKSGKLDEFLLIVPTNRKIRSLKREIISLTDGKACSKLNLETIGTLSSNLLFANTNMNAETLSESASAVLLDQCVNECILKYFSNYKNEFPHGTLTRIKQVISEYKKRGITPGILRTESELLSGSEKNKAEDIADIYERYQQKCRELNVKETGDIYDELNQMTFTSFEMNYKILYPSARLVVINGFDEFTSPEIEIINSVSKIRDVDLFIQFDYYEHNPSIFAHLDRCYEKLINKGFHSVKDNSVQVLKKFEGEIKENLFSIGTRKKSGSFKSSITKITASSREKEVELVAKEIKELIVNRNAEPNRICVVFNLIQNYSEIIRDIFPLYGLPFNLTDRIPLDSSSPVISIINFLEILENDFYYKNIFRALSGGYLMFGNIDKSNLLKASVNLKILSGYEHWVNTLEDALRRLDENDDGENSFNSGDRDVYVKALSDLKKLAEILLPFKQMMTLKEFTDNLNNLIFSLRLPSRLVNNPGYSVEENIKGITTFLETVKEIFSLFELEFGKNKKFPLGFFVSNLKTAVSSSRFNIKEKPGFGVQITNLEEIRGLKFNYLFISGLCDGDLPTRYLPEIFFSGSYLKNEKIHQTEEHYRFYQSLCSWTDNLYLTYPLAEDRKELVESNFLNEFSNLFDMNVKSERDYSSTLYSKEDLMVYVAQNKFKTYPVGLDSEDFNLNTTEIKESINIDEMRRAQPFGNSEYTGWINGTDLESAENIISDFKFKEFSISQLETYAKCPYKYMAERILKLKPIHEPTEDIEALEMGSLLHSILFRFYRQIREKGIVLAEADAGQLEYAETLIFRIAEKLIEEANFHSPLTFYEKEKVLGINGSRENSVLYKFLQEELNYKAGFIPEYFELSFGSKQRIDAQRLSVNISVDDINVGGKIDRIDIDKNIGHYKVIDYKLSGNKPSPNDLHEGISLQLPLYLYAAKEMIKAQLGADNEFEPAAAEIYSLKFSDEEFGPQIVKLLSGRTKFTQEQLIESNKTMIELCLAAIKKYVKAISQGKFNLSELEDRENKVCKYCSFRPVCRIQDIN